MCYVSAAFIEKKLRIFLTALKSVFLFSGVKIPEFKKTLLRFVVRTAI